MRLASFKRRGVVHWGVLRDDRIADVSENWTETPSVRQLLTLGRQGLEQCKRLADDARTTLLDTSEVQLLPPVHDPHKIICIGLNYRDHAEESGAKVPAEPVIFSKYPTALIGPDAQIQLPPVSQEVDYEAEFVVVIGKKGRNIPKKDAYGHVAGYTCGHDVSARDWQLKKAGGQWMIGKTFDTFAPLGPTLVTADEVPDPHSLGIRLRLNGEVMQDSNTSQMIFRVDDLLAYLSQVFTLEPGDLIYTGTPAGVGFARKPPVFLKPGDRTEVEIDRLGILSNTVVQG